MNNIFIRLRNRETKCKCSARKQVGRKTVRVERVNFDIGVGRRIAL